MHLEAKTKKNVVAVPEPWDDREKYLTRVTALQEKVAAGTLLAPSSPFYIGEPRAADLGVFKKALDMVFFSNTALTGGDMKDTFTVDFNDIRVGDVPEFLGHALGIAQAYLEDLEALRGQDPGDHPMEDYEETLDHFRTVTALLKGVSFEVKFA